MCVRSRSSTVSARGASGGCSPPPSPQKARPRPRAVRAVRRGVAERREQRAAAAAAARRARRGEEQARQRAGRAEGAGPSEGGGVGEQQRGVRRGLHRAVHEHERGGVLRPRRPYVGWAGPREARGDVPRAHTPPAFPLARLQRAVPLANAASCAGVAVHAADTAPGGKHAGTTRPSASPLLVNPRKVVAPRRPPRSRRGRPTRRCHASALRRCAANGRRKLSVRRAGNRATQPPFTSPPHPVTHGIGAKPRRRSSNYRPSLLQVR